MDSIFNSNHSKIDCISKRLFILFEITIILIVRCFRNQNKTKLFQTHSFDTINLCAHEHTHPRNTLVVEVCCVLYVSVCMGVCGFVYSFI